ncbi:hypothetical protein ACQZV8_21065, partial [Magnetococcales bacterium HHB-1]
MANQYDVETLVLEVWDDINIDATGKVNIDSRGEVILSSDQDMLLENITSGGMLRIAGDGDITGIARSVNQPVGTINHTLTATMVNFQAGGSVGTLSDPLNLKLATDGTITAKADGDIALTTQSDVMNLKTVDAGLNNVQLTAGSIFDALDNDAINITADTLSMNVQGENIGQGSDPLEIKVNTLEANLESYLRNVISIVNTGDLIIGEGGLSNSAEGRMVVRTSGAMTINGDIETGISDEGRILLQAEQGDMVIKGNLIAGEASVTLFAQGNMAFHDGVSFKNQEGTLDLEASTGKITMDDNVLISTGSTLDGDIRLKAIGDIVLGGVEAGLGKVALISDGGSIIDAGEVHQDIQASGLLVDVKGSMGSTGDDNNPLLFDTDIEALAVKAGGMITLSNESDLDVSSVTVAVNRVDRTGNQSAINENLTGLNTTLESSLSTDTNNTEYLHLQSKDGSITIDEKMTLTGGGGAELRL